MPSFLPLEQFLPLSGTLIDVRSPSEFKQGCIPGSRLISLFSDQERASVGKIYNQHSRIAAIEMGLELIEKKIQDLTDQLLTCLRHDPAKILCWRGGMRSEFIGHLVESLNFQCYLLQGGYKSFRRWTLSLLTHLHNDSPQLYVIGGLTGSGKTFVLQALKRLGEQVIDLESLACHRGSAFGSIDLPNQPTQEQFENELSYLWHQFDFSRPIWMEDEGRLIGKCSLPNQLYQLMLQAPFIYIKRPLTERIQQLVHLYGKAPIEQLIQSTQKLKKRLGTQLTKEISFLFENHDYEKAIEKLLIYYDKIYQYQLTQRRITYVLEGTNLSIVEWATLIQQSVMNK
jgi:tRNA 2-selenouridine synthase